MRSLREYAQFVGKPQQPISPRTLANYLRLNVNPNAFSLREIIQVFENQSHPLAITSVNVGPLSSTVPFEIGMQLTGVQGYVFGVRWQILRNGQQVAVYDRLKDEPGFVQSAHTFTEPGNYTVTATARGIGKDGYAEASHSVTVVAKANQTTPPPPPQPQPTPSNQLKLLLSPTDLVPGTLRVKTVEWKLIPFWNPSQPITRSGAAVDVTLPNPPANADARVSVELSIKCELAGSLNGVNFDYQEFNGFVEPFPATVGLTGTPLTATWAALWNMGPVNDGDQNPNNDPIGVIVVARLTNIT